MPNGQPAQLANLRPIQPGQKIANRTSAMTLKALGKCRRVAPEMVDLLVGFARDPSEASNIRVKCAEIILDKALPSPRARADQTGEGGPTLSLLEVVFVRPGETLEAAKGNGHTFAVSFDEPEEHGHRGPAEGT